MAKALRVGDKRGELHGWKVWCPACQRHHVFSTEEPNSDGVRWWLNGDTQHPTFRPSMSEWDGDGKGRRVCYSSVRDGKIAFHQDTAHCLAGQTVDLLDA